MRFEKSLLTGEIRQQARHREPQVADIRVTKAETAQ
jgi:hypothetical protein